MLNITTGAPITLLEDDRSVAPLELVEIGTLKDSKYMFSRAIVPVEHVADIVAGLNTYYVAKGREIPTVYKRDIGTAEWLPITSITSDIPDTLEGLAE